MVYSSSILQFSPSLFQTTIILLSIYGLYLASWQLTVGARRRRLIREHGCKPVKHTPEINSWTDSIFGWNMLKALARAGRQRQFLQKHHERFLQHGNTIHLKVASVDRIWTCEPEIPKAMLATNFKDFNLPYVRKFAFAPLLGKGIFTTDGIDWQHSRDLLRPNFNRSQVADLATFERHCEHLIRAIPRDSSTIDLQPLFFRLTIDSATEFLFGESTHCLAPGTSSDFAAEFAAAFNRSQGAAALGARNGPLASRFFQKANVQKDIKYVHDFTDHYVKLGLDHYRAHNLEKSVSKRGERYVFLHELVKATQDPIRLRTELLNILLAGRDTTASLLSNVWFELARNPTVWAKLRDEVDALDGEKPVYEDIKSMKYLRFVLNECKEFHFPLSLACIFDNLAALRLYPVVPTNTRMAVVDTVLPVGGGPDGKSPLFVPAGKNVAWSLYTMHRRKDIYGEDADEFKPERWETLRVGWEYLPFNGGPRICIGRECFLGVDESLALLMQVLLKNNSRSPKLPTRRFASCRSSRGLRAATRNLGRSLSRLLVPRGRRRLR